MPDIGGFLGNIGTDLRNQWDAAFASGNVGFNPNPKPSETSITGKINAQLTAADAARTAAFNQGDPLGVLKGLLGTVSAVSPQPPPAPFAADPNEPGISAEERGKRVMAQSAWYTVAGLAGGGEGGPGKSAAAGLDIVPRKRLGSVVEPPAAAPVPPTTAYELGQRLDKLNIPEGAKTLIVKNALAEQAGAETTIAFERQRRGIQTDTVIGSKAQVIAEQLDIQELSRTKAGTAFNAEENRAIRKSIAERATDLDRFNTAIQSVGLANAPVDLKLAALKAALELNSLQRVGAGARAEAGRALQSFKVIEEALMTKTPAAYDKAFQAIGGRADAEAKIARLQDLWNDSSRPLVQRERDVFNFVRTLDRATTGKKLEEFWLNSILSNPITHEINIIGNALLLTAERIPTRLAAAGIEELVTLHGLRRPKAVTFTDTAVGALATFAAVRKAAAKSLQYAKTGVSEADVSKFREAGTIGPRQALEGRIGTVINLPTRALGAEDAFFYTLAQEGEAASAATRQALSEGLSPFSAPFLKRVAELKATSAIQDAATKSADYVTLKTAPDKITQWLLDGRNKIPAARFILPFVQTPSNLVKRGFEYSPLGFSQLFKSGLSAEDRALVTGRAVVGSGILGYFAMRAMEGDVTGPAPSNAKDRARFYDEGKRPFAIHVGNSWVEFGRFEPLSTPIRWALAAKQAFDDTGKGLSMESVGAMSAAIGRALIDTTYLSGMSNLVNALEDPSGAGERTLSRIIAGGVPFSGFLRGLAGVDDQYLRDPKELLARVEAGLPGLSKSVYPMLNILGDPISRPPSRQGIGALVNPLVAEDRPPHPVIAEDARLVGLFGKEYTGISSPAASISGVALDVDQAFRHEQLVGDTRKAALSRLLADPKYQIASDTDKLQMWQQAAATASRVGNKAFGLELATRATNPLDVISGAHIALTSSDSNYARSQVLAVMKSSGTLSPDVSIALDAVRQQPDKTKASYDLSVDDYLRMGALRQVWERAPAFSFGTSVEWSTAARGADLLRKLIADARRSGSQSPTTNPDILDFYFKYPSLQTFYEKDGSRRSKFISAQRQLIEHDVLWDRFRPVTD